MNTLYSVTTEHLLFGNVLVDVRVLLAQVPVSTMSVITHSASAVNWSKMFVIHQESLFPDLYHRFPGDFIYTLSK